ncbi:acyl-CoA dehydrogenase family protein [Aestuariicoccus sp. MJ-SS9]|uniref:acyl-CoA dehydrogenase family protein n=1 Tax=Aestuariicoccus sp. MJ-SS9 TaxID=3079855 RepID=UPI0029138189|nr:acyl-CoA dehydrogenase family protein [Aestuariicoccus sp. MJ-SS9]MDU8912279.1 acyl-CoA dehydrogenase family protein [Aestuariicoccus sp. MJ-SS9]
MTVFAAPTEDILFSMRDVAAAGELPDWDDDLARDILTAFSAFAEGEIAPLDEAGDRQGCRLENGRVSMPDGFRAAYEKLAGMGWQGLTAPEDHGGMAQDPLIAALVSEVFSGANHAMQMVCNLVPGAMTTLLRFGTPAQQAEWLPRLAGGAALSTMCLTEPGAGSDLSRIRTRATRSAQGWTLSGEKIFISGGDQDLSDDILHLILARTGDVADGIKGLSLFLSSRSAAGSAIKVTRIEEKLGLHASPTCHMVFDDAPCELVGVEGEGLKAMFTLMNHARLDVALQGVAHAARAHAIAAAYAADRKQGRRADGRDAVLGDHPDVRRMLDKQRCLAMGARAMAHETLVEMVRGESPALVDFLTPVCKVFCSEAGTSSADLGIQILGGYGYLTEYRVGQTWRDARIASIYEGANGIHALATATRGLRIEAGADAFDALIGRLTDDPRVLERRELWRQARARVAASVAPAELAHDFMQLTAGLFYRAAWARIARVGQSDELSRLADTVISPDRDWAA